MKLIYILFALLITFSACKEEEIVTNDSSTIIGPWIIDSVILGSDTGSATLSPDENNFPSFLEFVEGGILYQVISDQLDTNVWVINSDSLYIGEGGEDFVGIYQVADNNLTLLGSLDENLLGFTSVTLIGTRN